MIDRSLDVAGVTVHVEGDGPETIVMIHGWPDTYRLWDAQVAALRKHWRCVRFTLPGFDVDQPARFVSVAEMMDLFGAIVDAVSPTQPVILMLHDWGCVFGYRFAALNPHRVSRMIGVDVGDGTSRDFVRSLSAGAKAGFASYQLWLASAWKLKGAVGDRMTRTMARRLRAPTQAQHIGWQMNYPYVLQWTGQFRDLVPFAPHCPLLYFHGERKPFQFQSPQWLERIRQAPGSAVHPMPTGHWVMVKAAQEFNAIVRDWLAVTKPSARTAAA